MVSFWPKILFLTILQLSASMALAQVEITSVTVPEDYCPGVTASASITEDSKAISVLFDGYQSQTARANLGAICQVQIRMKVPPGLRLGLISAEYRGFADVPAGVEVGQQVLSAFNVDPFSVIFDGKAADYGAKSIRGPYSGDYLFRQTADPKTVPRSNCSLEENVLNINIMLLVFAKNSDQPGTIMLDSADAEIPQRFGFDLVPCQ